jgi:diguanylate cyclase (GGDEF)-like protein
LIVLSFLSFTYAIHAKAHDEHLTHHIYHDPMTGLYNRRFFYKNARHLLQSVQGMKIGVLMIDIDHFKRINDTYGHDCGDQIIIQIGTLLADHLFNATVGRWGGEEFLAVIAVNDTKTLRQAGERVRRIVAMQTFSCSHQPFRCTITVGGTLYQPGDTLDTLIKRADEALYRGKESGRNRTVIV